MTTENISQLAERVAQVIIDRLELDEFNAQTFPKDAILFAKANQGGLGFDSIGSLEIAAGLSDAFNLDLDDASESDFTSVNTLARYIARNLAGAGETTDGSFEAAQ
ncbi:MAG TPA: phosphopantetheine-binding protein [Polyangiaceae bacterium]|nr:phosphopantetheine-binding protein [Polyangiaceae bacterium]